MGWEVIEGILHLLNPIKAERFAFEIGFRNVGRRNVCLLVFFIQTKPCKTTVNDEQEEMVFTQVKGNKPGSTGSGDDWRRNSDLDEISQRTMAQETNQTPGPMLCSTGCGFYGNPRTNGMCSVCYKEHLQRQQNSGRMSPMGTASGSNSPTSDSASVQRADASLNNCEGAAGSTSEKSRNVPVAALPVTQQMTEMSISREDKITTPKTEVSEPVVTQPSPSVSQPSTSQSEEKAPELPKPKKNRCFMCRKKVGLTGFDCRCGNLFCGLHRYSDKHNCPYDYKAEAAAKIRKENPVVVAEKIQRI
ncbi:hypothetical protein HPG69_007716 [Diceros bicornis minor]|nr:hypothetical protein HPG69_007716 [Diceros bicornis minor]